jgi:superfamily II RNA helicase
MAADRRDAGGGTLSDRVPPRGTSDPEEILGLFLDWVAGTGLTLYPAQEEALLEIMAGRNVILGTPTGSGKSLVALGLHFKAVCEGRVSFYTSPIKALASEKFFSLCGDFGAGSVGMLTGDASINGAAPVLCCTAEVLSNMALRLGEDLDAPYVVMDEFHYYADRERGVAWQVPLLVLPRTQFLLMSATLGDTSAIAERLKRDTGRDVAFVTSDHRPVPLDWEYRETPLHETIEELLAARKSPVYVVNFTQRECAELAQSLTSVKIGSKEEREEIRRIVGGTRLSTPYGKEFRRFLSFGIGVHHAGLLPRYRLLVEQLAQKGLLHVICGTDTLGVGVNIPIRTVLFTKLAKYDGTKVGLLSVRDFKQIAGRAGRKGFDDRGSVVAQAPEYVIEKKQAERKAEAAGKKQSRTFKGPAKGEVSWTEETFQKLISKPPETLKSRFRLTHGMVLDLLQRDAALDRDGRGAPRNFSALRQLVARCHEDDGTKARLLSHAAALVRSLWRAGIIGLAPPLEEGGPYRVGVADDLQWDFSLHHALSLFAVAALERLDPASPDYALDAVTVVESILEDPDIVLRKQTDRAKGKVVAELKAEGVPYEERMAKLEEVTYPRPLSDFLHGVYEGFRSEHPWAGGSDVHPKSIGREMFETFAGFSDYVKEYGLERSEGVVLRYLSQLYKALDQTVPEVAKTDALWDVLGFFRSLVGETDASLLEEWERLSHPERLLEAPAEGQPRPDAAWLVELLGKPRAFAARVRAEMHLLVRALSRGDWEEAAGRAWQAPEGTDSEPWDAPRLEAALGPFLGEHGALEAGPESRRHEWTNIRSVGPRRWEATQTLLGADGETSWAIFASIDLRDGTAPDGPILRLSRIGD